MAPYTAEGLTRHEQGSGPAEPQQYELMGIVVHSGQASAGHYYTYVKEKRCGFGALEHLVRIVQSIVLIYVHCLCIAVSSCFGPVDTIDPCAM